MKAAAFLLALLLPHAGFCGSAWYALAGAPASVPAAGAPADTLNACPRLAGLRAGEGYYDPPAVREVSPVDPALLPLPADDLDKAGLLRVLSDDLAYWRSRPDSSEIRIGTDTYDAPRMRATMQALAELFSERLTPQDLRKAIEGRFKIYRASADDGTGKTVITGYYEAEIPVTGAPDSGHKYPVYLRPPDLIKTTPAMGVDFDYGRYGPDGKLVRHYSTREVHAGALAGKGLELVWSAHPAQIMLLQIQGSGVLRFPDGDYIRAGFDGANGWPYRSVQKLLMDCGEVPAMSFKDFISYLASQGPREERLTDLDPRYVYFKRMPKNGSPYGAMGRALTPGRSIAIDPKYIPLGLFGLLKSRRPVAGAAGLSFRDFSRFVATEDTGSAIRGPGRVDLFWGSGKAAETEASAMKAPGEFYLFVLK